MTVENQNLFSQKREQLTTETACCIIDKVEDLLCESQITSHDNEDNEAIIYGEEYYKLEDEIKEVLNNYIGNLFNLLCEVIK